MSQHEVTPREALTRLGASTAEAIARVLEMFVPGSVERGEITVLAEGDSPFSNLPTGGVAASVSYVDGVSGANILVMSAAGARALATAMGVPAAEEIDDGLGELELSAVGEAANQTLAAAAAAISVVLGHEVEISPPETRIISSDDSPAERYGTAPHAISTTFVIAGEQCRLLQLVPSTFVVRMARAIDELSEEPLGAEGPERATGASPPAGAGISEPIALSDALADINLRVWAELGRTQIPLGQALELPVGAVVELDRGAEAPVDLYVNGLCFGRGALVVTDDGEWAVRVLELTGPAPPKTAALAAA